MTRAVALSLAKLHERNTKLEAEAEKSPGWYRLKVWVLATVSYLCALANALVPMALGIGFYLLIWRLSGSHELAWQAGAFAFVVILFFLWRVFHVRVEPPTARWLSRKEAPQLFQTIQDLRKELRCGPVHHVGVSLEHNAYVAAVPRFGLWGWPRHYLVMGIPLLVSMPEAEAKAMIAHELSHLSRRHDRLGAFVWRNHQIWGRLVVALGQHSGLLRGWLRGLAEFFTSRLDSHALVVIREHEFEADRMSAQATTAGTAASTLMRLVAISRHLDRDFWYQIRLLPVELARPPQDILERAHQSVIEAAADGRLDQHLEAALKVKRSVFNTHPSLKERVHALLQDECWPDWTLAHDAGETLFSPVWPRLLTDAELIWQQVNHTSWQHQHLAGEYLRKTLERLTPVWEHGTSTERQAWQLVRTCQRLHGPVASLGMLDYFIQWHPRHDKALLERGHTRLYLEDDRGIQDYLTAAKLNRDNEAEAYSEIASYLQSQGRDEDLKTYFEKIDDVRPTLVRADAERAGVSSLDSFLPHRMEEDEIESLVYQLQNIPDVACAYLACKKVKHLPTREHYIIGVDRGQYSAPDSISDPEFAQALAQSLSLPGSFHVVMNNKENHWLFRKIRKMQNSLIYDEKAA